MMACLNLEALGDMQSSTNDRPPRLPVSQEQLLGGHRHAGKRVDEASEASLQMLDACGTTRDVLSVMKHHVRDLQSAIRRTSVSESTIIETNLAAYNFHKKKLKKVMIQCLRGVKRKPLEPSALDHSLVVIVEVLREVRASTISIMESLLSLMSMPDGIPSNRLFAFKKLLSIREKCNVFASQNANKRLEGVEMSIENLEVELECVFRRLMQTRVLLLNILTC